MKSSELDDLRKLCAPGSMGVTVGHITQIDRDGVITVDFPGNEAGPIRARSMLHMDGFQPALPRMECRPVLLVFENGEPTLPIVVGWVHETAEFSRAPIQAVSSPQSPLHLIIDGQRVTIEAAEEIVLRCGDASITLKKNGRITAKGVDIVSRASRSNKLKGAAVTIN